MSNNAQYDMIESVPEDLKPFAEALSRAINRGDARLAEHLATALSKAILRRRVLA